MSKSIWERRADNLEKLALALVIGAFIGDFGTPYRLLLAVSGAGVYLTAEWLLKRDEGGRDVDNGT